MPQVPLYDGPQVALKPLQYDQASADMLGAQQGKNIERLGAGVSNVGLALDKINEREVQTQVFTAEAKAKEAYVAWAQDAVKNRQGEAAKGLVKDSADWWGKAAENFGKDMSPMAQRMFAKSISTQALAARQSMGTYENHQLDVAQQVSLKATTQSSVDSAVSDSSDKNVATQRANILAAWESQRGKYDAGTFDALVRGELTRMHEAVFNKLFVENPSQAKLYYEVNQKEIAGQVKDNILTRLKAGLADVEGGGAAREVFGIEMRGKSLNDAIPYDAMDAKLVERFGNEPEKLKAARMELDRQVAMRNKTQTEVNAGAIEGVYAQLNKNVPLSTVMRSSAWASLPAQTQRQIQQGVEDRWHALQVRDVEDRARRLRVLEMDSAPEMLRLVQPEVLSKMSRADIMLKMPELGPDNTGKLLTAWGQYQNNQAKLSQANVDNDMFKSILAGAGIDPAPKTNNKEGAKRVLDLRTQVEVTLGQMQQGQKREFTATEKQKVMQDIVNAEVLRPKFWTSGFGGTEKVANLKPGEMNTSGVNISVDGKTQPFALKNIPSMEYAAVEAQLIKEGVAPTPQAVAQAWSDFQRKKAVK